MSPPNDWSVAARVAWFVAWLVVGGGLAVSGWIFGMLMFAFSMDGGRPDSIPSWLEPAMLVGWPVLLGLAVIGPGIAWLVGASWGTILTTLGAFVGLAVVSYAAGWIVLIVSLSS